jgi:small subunit ribosomal protein S4
MKIGPRYKIARRLGAPVFEKTQTQKFVLSQARKDKAGGTVRRSRSEFGIQLLEKQKARYTYCIMERQFSKYAKEALAKKDTHAVARLYESLEMRADNIAYRAGLAASRLAGRQMVAHGHFLVNGKRINVPSYRLKKGDVLSVREGSMKKPLFAIVEEKQKTVTVPSWILYSAENKTATIQGTPKYEGADSMFDLNAVLEFYSR